MDEENNLIKYVKEIHDFEKYINDEKKNLAHGNHIEFFGYLINLKEYEKLKSDINYEKYLPKYKASFSNPLDAKLIKSYTLEEIKFRDSNYLLNKIFNENKYILISKRLWNILCNEDKKSAPAIKFDINYIEIKFKLDDDKELKFKNKGDYIISEFYNFDIPNISFYKSNYEYIVKIIYNMLVEHHSYEKEFKEKLKIPSKKKSTSGFLVDIGWFKKWEEYYHYLEIKSNVIKFFQLLKYYLNSIKLK